MVVSAKVVLEGHCLCMAELAFAARDPGIPVAAKDEAWARVDACRRWVDTIVTKYESTYASGGAEAARAWMVYGVTTGFGEFKKHAIAPEMLVTLQRNLLRSHAAGVGDNADADDPGNYFPAEVVRAALILRVNTFLKGYSGVRRELVECLLDMIHRGVVPLVPKRGSLGSSGDLCPLAHTFLPLLGEGRFYCVETAEDVARGARGAKIYPGSELAAVLGYGRDRPIPAPVHKEGLALTNGATYSAAMLALAVHDAEQLANTCDVAAALSLEAMNGRTAALAAEVHAARNFVGQAQSAANLRSLVAGSRLVDQSADLQDAYSLRCAPQVHGASRDVIAYAKMVAEAEINAATDNPLFLPIDESGEGTADDSGIAANGSRRAVSAGNFHGQPIAVAADALTIALAELADISERRTQMLLDANHNRGLPANLTTNPGVNSGFMIAQYTAASLVSENKTLAHPASVDSIPTSANVEDHVAMATWASRKLTQVLANAQAVAAIELLIGAQAAEWRVAAGAGDSKAFPPQVGEVAAALGKGTSAAYTRIRATVAPMPEDRVLEPDIRAVRQLVAAGEIVQAVTHGSGDPSRRRGPTGVSFEPIDPLGPRPAQRRSTPS